MIMLIASGNLGADPETRFLPSGSSVTNFSIAHTERWTKDNIKQERTEWVRCTAFGKTGEIISEYATKGDKLLLEGTLRTRSYEKEGQAHYSTECIVERFEFLSPKPTN